jgi:hypothetical protein
MTDLSFDPVMFATLSVALGGFLAGFFTGRRLQALTRTIIAFAEEAACYYRISKSGDVTIDEEQEMGRAAIRFFEEVEKLGIEVLNRDTCGG